MSYTTTGDRIRMQRERMGMTQEELALKLGYKSRSSVNKIENSRELSLKKVSAVANVLSCSESYLMGWDKVGTRDGTEDAKFLKFNLQKEDKQLKKIIEVYNNLDDKGKKLFIDLADYLSSNNH